MKADIDEISESNDIIDSRDVEARIAYLESVYEDADDDSPYDAEREELELLKDLRDGVSSREW